MELILTAEEVRVLGVLVEKQMTTPEYYPMTVNALKNGCNQKSNRYPVVDYDEQVVRDALERLRGRQLVMVESGGGSRVRKYEHRLRERLFLTHKEIAVLAVLMLRGPQTIGEMRGRTDRMVEFDSLEEVAGTLGDMLDENRSPAPLAVKLPRQPGQKENRYAHLLAGEPPPELLVVSQSQTLRESPDSTHSRLLMLEERFETLEKQISALSRAFQEFKKQFE